MQWLCTIYCVRKLEINHFCQLCGNYIMLLCLMSLGSVKKSIEALLTQFYQKAATSDMIQLGLDLVRTTTECLHLKKIPSLVVDQILCDIRHYYLFGKGTSVFHIERPSHRDGLACGLLWEIFYLKTLETRIN